MLAPLTIARRFRGPRTSANGGYAAGLLAQAVDAAAVEVTLRLPPPLERPLARRARRRAAAAARRRRARRRGAAGDPGVDAPAPPTFAEAARGVAGRRRWGAPEFDECFVCGTRPEGDGLEIHAGRVPGRDDDLVATTWVASEVRPEIVWAAIDCPGAYALRGEGRGEPLLARITARIDRLAARGRGVRRRRLAARCRRAQAPCGDGALRRGRRAACGVATAVDRAAAARRRTSG